MPFTRALLALALVAGTNVLRAQPADSSTSESVAPGVTHTRLVRLSGPFVINVLALDLRSPEYALRHERALDLLRGREKTSAMVVRLEERGERVVAALNADFFDLKTGESENNSVVDGEWWKGVALADSRADSSGHIHSQFALDAAGHPLIDQFAFDGIAFTARDTFSLTALNSVPRAANTVAFLSARYDGPLESDTIRTNFHVQLTPAGRRADTLLYVRGVATPNGAALVGYESFALRVGSIRAGETLKVVPRTNPRTSPLAQLAGGWPRIVRDGENVAARAHELEGSLYTNIGVRNPRTAIGFSRDSTTLWLVTVDGRSNASVGMTGVELGDFMRELGAYQALNLDGGGSTTMIVRDRIVNAPSDSAGERPVGDALVLIARGASQAPSPVPALDSARLIADISALAADSMEGRRIGTPGSARARTFLVGALKRIGIAPVGTQFETPFTAKVRTAELNGVNLVGVVRGTKHADRFIVVSAHYDHLGVRNGVIYNGADDNASGTAAVLAMAAWFKRASSRKLDHLRAV